MGNGKKKIIPRFFTVADFEQEESFLKRMSLKGWHFCKSNGFLYYFQKGERKDYTYKMDFIYQNQIDDDYTQMFLDGGWEMVFESQKFTRIYPPESPN